MVSHGSAQNPPLSPILESHPILAFEQLFSDTNTSRLEIRKTRPRRWGIDESLKEKLGLNNRRDLGGG